MTHTETTRRGLLGGAGLLATMVAARCTPMPAAAATMPASAVSPRLQRLIAVRDRVQAACERFDCEVRLPAQNAADAEISALPLLPKVPHQSVATTFVNIFDQEVRLSTDKIGSVATAERVVNDPTFADMGDETWRQAHRELVALADSRNATLQAQFAARQAVTDEIEQRHQYNELERRMERLWDREYLIRKTVLACPAASLADVIAKLDFVSRTSGLDDPQEVVEFLIADVRRIAETRA